MNQRVRKQALDALSGMAKLVRAERLVRGSYLSDAFDPERSGALCQGHTACLIGSLWLGAGVKVEGNGYFGELPGVQSYQRAPFLSDRPGLKVAYDALNAAAERKLKRLEREHPKAVKYYRENTEWNSTAEGLFETRSSTLRLRDREDILRLIASARREINAA